MTAPTPQSETVELANAALNLPVDAVQERTRLLFRLRTLVRQVPSDDAARVGLLFAALYSGERNEALAQLEWLASRYRSLDTAALANIVGPLVMVGNMGKAKNTINELSNRSDYYQISDSPTSITLWGLLAGASDSVVNIAKGDHNAFHTYNRISEKALIHPIIIFGKAVSETIGREACIAEIDIHDEESDSDFTVYCAYRVPGERPRRRALFREFYDLWRDRLAEAGLDEADYLGLLTADVLPMPTGDRAAA